MNKTMAIVAILMLGTVAGSMAAEKLYISFDAEPDSVFLYTTARDSEAEAAMATMSYVETIWRLDLETGKYREVGKFKSSRGEGKPIDDAEHNLLFMSDGRTLDLTTMKYYTPPYGGGVVSPDGKFIYSVYVKDNEVAGASVIDGKTYKLITTTTEFTIADGSQTPKTFISEDGKYLYTFQRGTDKTIPQWSYLNWDYLIVNTGSLKIVKKIPFHTFMDVDPKTQPADAKFPAVWISDVKQGKALVYLREGGGKEGKQYLKVYDLEQGTTEMKHSVCGGPALTPDATKIVCNERERGIRVFDVSTGTESVTFTLTTLPERDYYGNKYHVGAIIKFLPDSSGFIYNTTEELITFSIPEKTIVRRVPIQYPEGLVR